MGKKQNKFSNEYAQEDLIAGVDKTTKKQQRFTCVEVPMLIYLGVACFLGVLELSAAFIRNSHVLGFVFGCLLFLTSGFTILLLIIFVKKSQFFGSKKMIIFGLLVFSCILLGFTISFLSVKILNYTQKNTNLPDQKIYTYFPPVCQDQVKDWSKITFQSRVEHSAVVQDGLAYYAQTSHTDVFLGRIIDGVYTMIPYLAPIEGKVCNQFGACFVVSCSDRIGGKDRDWGRFETDFATCMQANNNEKFNKCTLGQG